MRVAAQKHTSSPEEQSVDKRPHKLSSNTLSAVPSTSTARNQAVPDLTGVPTPRDTDILLDLIVNRETSNPELTTTTGVDPVSTEEELDAIDALLSLGEVCDDTLDENNNAELMPVGAPTNIIDAVPVPVRLDQLNVDTAIAEIVQTEELEQQIADDITPIPDEADTNKPADAKGSDNKTAEGSTANRPKSASTDDRPKSASPTQGSLKIKMHALKKKADSN